MQARVAVASGVVDGVMLDWWSDEGDRPLLAKAVRDGIGPTARRPIVWGEIQRGNGQIESYRSSESLRT